MANLLPDRSSLEAFPPLEGDQLARFASRLRSIHSIASTIVSADTMRPLRRHLEALDLALEELETEPSLASALEVLDGVERARLDAIADDGDAQSVNDPLGGELICYSPGRSLSTGEPDVASRGFFDGLDRPPIEFWVEAIARPEEPAASKFEIAIIAWVPSNDIERARAGTRACRSDSLASLSDRSIELANQLQPFLLGEA